MSEKIVAIHQPNFLPWLGFFNKIYTSDVFVVIDEVQFVKQSICNRTKILAANGEPAWLTVPVKFDNGSNSNFLETHIADPLWYKKGLNLIRSSYITAPFYKQYHERLEEMLSASYDSIATMNFTLIKFFCQVYNITTPIYRQSEMGIQFGKKNLLNLGITQHFNGNIYLSGNGARKYNDSALFESHHIEIRYQSFTPQAYPQQWSKEFIPGLSVIDLLFNVGAEGERFIKA
jgi:hypothetical protein